MDKQELTEKYIRILQEMKSGSEFEHIYRTFLSELLQLDEPQKLVVPQFVADWIKYCKCTGVELQHALNMEDLYFYNYANQKDDLKLKEFFESENNQDLFARAWLDGYEIEKEKQYLVKIKATKHFFARDGLRRIFFSLGYKSWFTREELEQAGFGWVFDCPGIEIEEVE